MSFHHEDRFFTATAVKALTDDLLDAGVDHVIALHKVNPEWRKTYRIDRPELDGWMWSVTVNKSLMPMEMVLNLAAVCHKHGCTFWMGGSHADKEGCGPQIYLRVERKAQA